MKKNVIVTIDQEITYRLSKALPTKRYNPGKMNKQRDKSKSDGSKLIALQDALQDPVTIYEGN